MSELVAVLFGLFIVWLIVTLCGHLSWVLTASVLKSLFGDQIDRAPKLCPRCGRQSLVAGQCTFCRDVPLVSTMDRARDELLATANQLARLQTSGHLPYDQCVALLKVIESDLARFGMTLPPAVWRQLDLKAAPTATRPLSKPVELSSTAPIVITDEPSAVLDAPVLDALIVDEPVSASLSTEAARVQPAPLATASGENPFATSLAKSHEPAPKPLELPPPVKVTRSRTLADMLQGFMDESNIRWGEILGGLLIVSCAIGLVISLRATLEHIPYFPALLFMIFTISFHGAGLYTLRYWKLTAVSRAILIIALLLVSLSFSAGVVLSPEGEAQRPINDPYFLTALIIGLGVFGWVSYSGSRELAGEGALRMTAALLGCGLAQVVINRGATSEINRPTLIGLAALPVAAFLVAALGQIFRAQTWRRMSSKRIEQTFLVLGISVFALFPPLALLVAKVNPHWPAFVQLAPLVSLVATSVLALGLVVHRRTMAKSLAALRTAGTSVALLGGALLILTWVVVWPQPDLMLQVSVLTGVLLLAIALRTGMPALHAAALGALSAAAFIGFAWWLALVRTESAQGLHWVQALLQGKASLFFTIIAATVGGCGAWLAAKRDQRLGMAYFAMAGVLGALSLAIAGWSGFVPIAEPWTGDGDLTGPLFLAYGIALLAIGIGVTSEAILAAGMALLWVALLQLLDFNETTQGWLKTWGLMPERPALVATILEGVILSIIAIVLSKPDRQTLAEWLWTPAAANRKLNPLLTPLTYGAALAIISATPFILWVRPGQFGVHALYAGLCALVWGLVCIARRWPVALAAFQAMTAVAVAFATATWWAPTEADLLWFLRGGHLQAQLLALAASAGTWSIVRRFAREQTALHQLLHPEFPACDHLLLGLGVALLSLLAVSSALPGMAWELGFGEARISVHEIAWLDQAHLGRLAWGAAAIGGALFVALLDRVTGPKLIGLALTGWAGLFLATQYWEPENATASAARWLFALYGALLMLAFVFQSLPGRWLQSQTWLRTQRFEVQEREWFRFQPLVLGVLPMLALTVVAVIQHASGVSLREPLPESIFARMGHTISYAGPLLVGVTIFIGLALGERQSAFALAGGGLFQLAANLAFILHITGKTYPIPEACWAECLQWNTFAAAAYAMVWLALSPWILPREPGAGALRLKRDPYFLVQVGISVWLLASAAIWAAGGIMRFPDTLAVESQYLGPWSTIIGAALLVTPLLTALGVSSARRTWTVGASALALFAAVVVPLIGIRWEMLHGKGSWAAFHVLEIGWLAIAGVVAMIYAWQERNTMSSLVKPEHRAEPGYAPHHAIVAGLCTLIVFLAVRGNRFDPWQPVLSSSLTAGVCIVCVVLGMARRSQPYAFASLAAAPLAASLPWFTPALRPWIIALDFTQYAVSLSGCLLAAMVVAGWWQALEIQSQRRLQQTYSPRWFGPLAGHVALVIVLLILAIASLLHLLVNSSVWYVGRREYDWGLLALSVVWIVLGIVSIGSLWDRRAMFIFPVLLLWLLIACALGLAPFRLAPLPMFCLLGLSTAGVFALAGHLWSYGANLAAWGEKLGISDTIGGLSRIERWLPVMTAVIGALICCQELGGMLFLNSREYRVPIAFAPALIAYAFACLAQQKRRAAFQLTALLLGGLSCVYLGWADLDPGWGLSHWMTRAFRGLMVLGAVTFGYGLILPRLVFRDAGWLRASQSAGYVSSSLAIATLVSLLALELALFEPDVGAGVEGLQVAAVAVLLVVFIIGLISLALAPGAEQPSEQRKRTWFVYAAQIVAGLLFAHLYLCQPGWFDGILKPYWPYIVMAIAFSGVGLGELFWRLRLPVLAEPFQRSGSFLPLLPVIGLWVIKNRPEYDFTLILFLAGLMYLILSALRKSWAAAIAAAVAGNGALWALLNQEDWTILQHPQFWLIPPAVSVLVAAHINRHRLKDDVLSAIRYASLIVIYVSSTFEIFLHRAETSLWPPVILAILALSGSLAGVLFQVRAFLYLGTVFTLLAMVSMVWHAARAIEHVWPWWAFGIGMGIAILGLLAFFEKNRSQVEALVQRLRQWDH